MGYLYFKVQTEDEAIPLIRTIKEVGNCKTNLIGDASPGAVYGIEYEDTSFKINYVGIMAEKPSGILCKNLSQCEFIHFPIEIQKEMINRSRLKSIVPFLITEHASSSIGGFDWNNTPEGIHFWESIIVEKQFDLFFKQKEYKENIKSFNLKQQQNENENQLQKERIPQSGRNEPRKTGVLCRGHKAKITIGHLSNQARLGRG